MRSSANNRDHTTIVSFSGIASFVSYSGTSVALIPTLVESTVRAPIFAKTSPAAINEELPGTVDSPFINHAPTFVFAKLLAASPIRSERRSPHSSCQETVRGI